jgi:hypothetical protein
VNVDPNQSIPPGGAQLARLANALGLTPPAGTAGAPANLQSSANPLGMPVPLPPQGAESDEDDWESKLRPADTKQGAAQPRPRSRQKLPLRVDVPFEIVVACGPEGVVIHPGGFQLSSKVLKSNHSLLLDQLKSIVQTRRQVDPMIHPVPSIRFLVEPGGSPTYWEARRQTMLSGMNWPIVLQVSDSGILESSASRESL